jgi:hypothetical protein
MMNTSIKSPKTPDRRGAARLAEQLDELAQRVQRLSPSHHDPERYHVEKSEIVEALRSIAIEAVNAA